MEVIQESMDQRCGIFDCEELCDTVSGIVRLCLVLSGHCNKKYYFVCRTEFQENYAKEDGQQMPNNIDFFDNCKCTITTSNCQK